MAERRGRGDRREEKYKNFSLRFLRALRSNVVLFTGSEGLRYKSAAKYSVVESALIVQARALA
jgi:hypothetical protein